MTNSINVTHPDITPTLVSTDTEPRTSTSISWDEKQLLLEMLEKEAGKEVNNSRQQEELVEIGSLFSNMKS